MGEGLAEFARRTSASTTNYIQTTETLQAQADKINAGDYPQRAECERFMKFVNTLLKSKPFQKAIQAQVSKSWSVEEYSGSEANLRHPEAKVSQSFGKEEQSCYYGRDVEVLARIGEFSYDTSNDGYPMTSHNEVLRFSRQFKLEAAANGDALIQEFVTELKAKMEPRAFLDTVIPVLEKFAGQKRRAPDRKGQPEVK